MDKKTKEELNTEELEEIKRVHIQHTIKRIHNDYGKKVAGIKYVFYVNYPDSKHEITISRFNTNRFRFQTAREAHNFLLGVEKGIECGYAYGVATTKIDV